MTEIVVAYVAEWIVGGHSVLELVWIVVALASINQMVEQS